MIYYGYSWYSAPTIYNCFVSLHYRGGYRKPTYYDILWVQLVFSPYYIFMYIKWYLRWIWKFTIRKEDYGEEEKLHIIRKFLKLGTSQFDVSIYWISWTMICYICMSFKLISLILYFNICTFISLLKIYSIVSEILLMAIFNCAYLLKQVLCSLT